MKFLRIAVRNVLRHRRRSVFLGSAIVFGVVITVLLNGFSAGLIVNIQENFAHYFAGHIFVKALEKADTGRIMNIIRDDTQLLTIIEGLDIPYRFILGRSSFTGTLIFHGRNIVQRVEGVDWNTEINLEHRLEYLEKSPELMSDPRSIILSEPVVLRLGAEVGETVLVRLRTIDGQFNVGEFILAGIIANPGLISNLSAYAHIEYVNALMNIDPGSYETLSLFLDDPRQTDLSADRLYGALSEEFAVMPRLLTREGIDIVGKIRIIFGNEVADRDFTGTRYEVFTLDEMLSEVKLAAYVLDIGSLTVLVVLMLIIMVGIMNTFRIVITERVAEIGTLRAMGMQRSGVRVMFLLEAACLSAAAVVLGYVLAIGIMKGLSLMKFAPDSPLYVFMKQGHPTFRILPRQVVGNVLIVCGMAALAAFFPARKASRLEPAEALRKVSH